MSDEKLMALCIVFCPALRGVCECKTNEVQVRTGRKPHQASRVRVGGDE